jgi:hypothetical protein
MLKNSNTEMDLIHTMDGEMFHQVNHHLLKFKTLEEIKLNQEFMIMLKICLSQLKREEDNHHIHTMGGKINVLHWHKDKTL